MAQKAGLAGGGRPRVVWLSKNPADGVASRFDDDHVGLGVQRETDTGSAEP